jgi:signal transduction histidine kinase
VRAKASSRSSRWLSVATTSVEEGRARFRIGRAYLPFGQHAWIAILSIGALMGLCFASIRLAGGANHLSPSWFCLPIVMSGAYLGYRGGVLSALLATLLAGPLVALDTAPYAAQPPSLWVARGGLFLVIGLLSALASGRVRASYERQLQLAETSLDLATRRAAMIEMVSKEFRAPLTTIRGATDALERRGMVPDEARPLLAGLESGTQRLVDLVAAVSAVLEAEDATGPMRIDTFSVKSLLRRVVDHLGVRDPGARVTFAIEPSALTCRTDPELLYQLLRHLVENAVKFSEDEVQVSVGRPSENRFVFEVSDRGRGIDERTVRKASSALGTGTIEDLSPRGLGLGLFAAMRLARVLGGSVEFADRSGGGTVATLTIPATSPEPLPA